MTAISLDRMTEERALAPLPQERPLSTTNRVCSYIGTVFMVFGIVVAVASVYAPLITPTVFGVDSRRIQLIGSIAGIVIGVGGLKARLDPQLCCNSEPQNNNFTMTA